MLTTLEEGGTSAFQLWPDPGAGASLGAEGWLVNLHVTRTRRGARAWLPDPVLIIGSPTMTQLWETTYVDRSDVVEVELIAPARVERRYPPLPGWVRRPEALAPDAVMVWATILAFEAGERLGWPAPDAATVLGQRRHLGPGTWSA